MFARRVRELRQAQSLTQEQLARASGVTVKTIERIESLKHAPQPLTAKRIAEALGVAVEDLYVDPVPA